MLDSHPELTIEAVAFSCGFSIPSTFYRLFRRQWGISPAEYRKMAESNGRNDHPPEQTEARSDPCFFCARKRRERRIVTK